jgi:hypothetical protein
VTKNETIQWADKLSEDSKYFSVNLHPERPHACLKNVLANGLASHMLDSMRLLGSNLNVHAKPEKPRPARDTTDIHICLLKVKNWIQVIT